MKLKKILRIVFTVVYWVGFGYLICLFLMDKNTTINNIAVVFYCTSLIICIIKYIFEVVLDNKRVKRYKLLFYYLTQSHKARYSCLLQGDTKGAKEFEDLMKMCSDTILKVGPSIAKYKTITKKERKEVQRIVDEAKVLITTIHPSV